MSYAQPPLALLDPPTAPSWRAVVDRLAAAGLRLERRPKTSVMETHRADWSTAATLPNGDYVWVRVLNYRGTLRSTWQMYGYRTRPGCDDNRVMLHDPTPREAMAALTILLGDNEKGETDGR